MDIFLENCLYSWKFDNLKNSLHLAKVLCLSYYLLCFLFNKIRAQEDGTGSAQKWCGGGGGVGEVAYTMYTHVRMTKLKKKFKASEIFGDPPREKRKNCLHM
jgi:hypothetical protein